MEITSIFFILLVLISSAIYYGLGQSGKVAFLILLSAAFIASLHVFYLIYILLYTLLNYWIGLSLYKKKHSTEIFWLGIFTNILQLVLLKYTSKFIDITNTFLGGEYLLVPLGISFFTLQGIGYLINIRKGWELPERNFSHFCLYILFFPKFLSGPIERSNRFLPQLKKLPELNEKNVVDGIKLVILGIFQKAFIANQLYSMFVRFKGNVESLSTIESLLMIFMLPLVLYFDFSGYTNIALGVARVYGLTLSPNFDHPFKSQTISQFWRKFHMSLSSWLNDYIYKQLTYRIRSLGKIAPVISVFITFLFFGIWHGSGINFIIIGIMQSLVIIYEFSTRKMRTKYFPKNVPYLDRILTYTFYSLTLVFFFFENLKDINEMFRNIFIFRNLPFRFIDFKILIYTTTGLILLFIYQQFKYKQHLEKVFLILMLLIIISFSSSNVFIYQNF